MSIQGKGKTFFTSFTQHRNGLWILIALLIKGLFFVFFSHHVQSHSSFFPVFTQGGDTHEYYLPIESFVNGFGLGLCRMPGLLPIYAPLYAVFGTVVAQELVIFIQFFLSACSVFFLARLAEEVFESKAVFLIVFFLYALSSFVSIWDHYGMAESLSTSFLIMGVYFFFIGLKNSHKKIVFLSGLLLAWSIFLTPVTGVVWIMLILFLFLNNKKKVTRLSFALIFALPFIFADSLWTARNYVQFHVFVPLEVTPEIGANPGFDCRCQNCGFTPQLIEIRKLITAWGGQVFCERNSEANWFYAEWVKFDPINWNPFTDDMYTSYYNIDSLLVLRTNYFKSIDSRLSNTERQVAKESAVDAARRYRLAYAKERPVYMYLINPVKRMVKFIFEPLTENYGYHFYVLNWYHYFLHYGYQFLYYFVSIAGLLGIGLAFITRQSKAYIVSFIPFLFIFSISGILGYRTLRYFVPVYPFLLIFASFFLYRILSHLRSIWHTFVLHKTALNENKNH